MAATGELYAWIKQAKSGWAQESVIAPIVRDVVNILCKCEQARFMMIDPSTGRPYLLSTTDNNFGPYQGPVGSWRVTNILLKEPVYQYLLRNDYNTLFGEEPYGNSTEPITINGNWYYPYPFCKFDDALDGQRPIGYFSRNPGSSVNRFYMQAYRAPTPVTSSSVPLPIPDSYGCHRLYVFPACLKLIEGIDHGNVEDAVTYIEGTIKPLMWKVLNKGAQGKRNRVTPRPY
jgi:hypothetical protein